MMSYAVLLLCAVTELMLGSTLKSAQEMNTEDEVSKQMSKLEEWLLSHVRKEMAEEVRKIRQVNSDMFEELSKKLEIEQIRMSNIEKDLQKSIDALTDRLQNEKDNQFAVNKDILSNVFDLQKRDLEMFETIASVQSEARSDRVRADLIQVQLNETANMTQSCLPSQTEIQETMQKNAERLDLIEGSNLLARIGNVENSFKTLRQNLDCASNRQDDTLKLAVQNNTNDIGQLQQELSRIQAICIPPCENGGECVKNVCNCTPSFTGDRCQQDEPKCGVDFNNDDSNEGGNISSKLVWPWMAVVYNAHNTEYICDGSVVHRHFVLVSAWCVYWHGSAGFLVKLGLSDLKQGAHLQEYRVQSMHMHPEFNRFLYNNFLYNIGMLELKEPIQFGPFVRPVCLPPTEIPQDELFYKPESTVNAVRLGEYLLVPRTQSPRVLNLTIVTQEECRRGIKESKWTEFYPSRGFSLCAEIKSNRRCPHEGSPLMQSRLSGDGIRTWTQVGIQTDCTYKYIIGPRVDHLRAWVEEIIEASSKR